jgi:hypothetical protein
MRKLQLITLAAVFVLTGIACSSGEGEEGASGGSAATTADDDVRAAGSAGGGGQEVGVGQSEAASLPPLGSRVIQTASLTLSVPQNRFQETVDRARQIALTLGGTVAGSSSSMGGLGRLDEGTVDLRVPAERYRQAMERFEELGRLEALEESGQDVSQEFVDLEARARHLEAVERQLLELLDRADTVAAALQAQSQLNQVQLDLEQARGRLRYLEDQVTYATISLVIRERHAVPAASEGGPWGIVDAWRTAAHGFVTVVGWILVAAVTVAPVLLLAILILVAARIAGRRVSVLRRARESRPGA